MNIEETPNVFALAAGIAFVLQIMVTPSIILLGRIEGNKHKIEFIDYCFIHGFFAVIINSFFLKDIYITCYGIKISIVMFLYFLLCLMYTVVHIRNDRSLINVIAYSWYIICCLTFSLVVSMKGA